MLDLLHFTNKVVKRSLEEDSYEHELKNSGVLEGSIYTILNNEEDKNSREEFVVTVVDSIMGGEKTSWAIEYINQHPDENIVYIAPYTDETERIKQTVHRDIKTPAIKDKTFKLGNLLTLLQNEEDIASTHKLFLMLTNKHKEAIERGEYTLFIDETLEAVSQYEATKKDDIQYLLYKAFFNLP